MKSRIHSDWFQGDGETAADRSQRQWYRAIIQWNTTLTEEETWKWRMMVHINPRVSLGFPSAMSSFLMLTSLTWKQQWYKLVNTARFLVTRHCHCSDTFLKVLKVQGLVWCVLPAGVWGSPVLSVHSAVCGIACGLFLWAEKERKRDKDV